MADRPGVTPGPGVGAAGHPAGGADDWPPPIPLGAADGDLPAFPTAVLPDWLAAFVTAQADELQVPADLVGLTALGLAAGGIGRKVAVRVRDGFVEPADLFVMAALPPGERKTQTFAKSYAPVKALEAAERERMRPVIAEAESEFRIAEARVKHLEGKIAKCDDPADRDALRADLGRARAELAAVDVPAAPVFWTEDDTPEALKAEVIRQGGRMLVATTEAACLEAITRYSERANFDVYLKGHAGDDMRVGRVARGRSEVARPALTCVLVPQPAVLAGLAATPELRGRGFLARWLYALPPSRVGRRRVAAPAVPAAVRDRYDALMAAVWQTPYAAGDGAAGEPHVVPLDPAAEQAFREFEGWVEGQLGPGRPLAPLAGWGNKRCGATARLAAVLHALDRAGGGGWRDPVPAGAVARAVDLCRGYLLPHARAAFALMGADGRRDGFTKRDCFRALEGRFPTVDQLDPCLDLLERHFLIRAVPVDRPGPGRKPSPVYQVNPRAGGDAPGGGGGDGPEGDAPPPTESTVSTESGALMRPEPPDGHSVDSVDSVGGLGGPATAPGGLAPATCGAAPAAGQPLRQNRQNRRNAASDGGRRISDPDSVDTVDSVGGGGAGADGPAAAGGFVRVADPAGVAAVAAAVGLDPDRDRIRLIQVAVGDRVSVVDVFALPDPAADLGPLFDALAGVEVVGHNLQFDLRFLAGLGFVPGDVYDTMLASQVLHAGERTPAGRRLSHKLADVAERELGRVLDKGEQRSDWSRPELSPDQLRYAAADAAVPVPLRDALAGRLADAGLADTAAAEMAALKAVAWAAPIAVDGDAWAGLAAAAEADRDRLAAEMDALVPGAGGRLFDGCTNWDSPDQVRAAFAAVGVEVAGTGDDVLAGVGHPLAGKLREHRAASKLAGTYGRGWPGEHAPDGLVRPNWRQCGTESGRMSCSDPNLQQVPRSAGYRRCFVARPGMALVKADYSQIELRAAAAVAGEPKMIEAYRRGDDLHTLTAAAVLGKPAADVTKADRQLAKAVNFGLLYGMGAKGLRSYAKANYSVDLTDDRAAGYRNAFFRSYPGLKSWHDRTRVEVGRLFRADPAGTHEVRTRLGRRRVLPVGKRGAAGGAYPNVTEALNFPVQGTAADGLKRALGLLWDRRADCPGAYPVLFVHDEVVVECPADRGDDATAWLTRAMADGMAELVAPVPVGVEAAVGPTWGG